MWLVSYIWDGGQIPFRRRRSTGSTPPVPTRPAAARGEHLETDHRTGWAKTHMTVLHDLDRLCGFDHWRKTYLGWELVEGKGKRAFVPPDDPRHPGQARRSVAGETPGQAPA